MFRVIIVEDDEKIGSILESHLRKYGYYPFRVTNFSQVKKEVQDCDPHLVIMDINLPEYDGFYWCRQIRTFSLVPIIFLSARVGEMDQVFAIENGGDDYVTKPFSLDVLMAKVHSVLRRTYGEYRARPTGDPSVVKGLVLDETRNLVKYNALHVELSMTEFRLLRCLASKEGMIVSREELLESLWDDTEFVDDNTLSVNVARVRKRLDELGLVDVIRTVRRQGYMLQLGHSSDHNG